MKKQELILELHDFINNYIKENNTNMVASNTVYNYFCFLYQKNTKVLTVHAFVPLFCKIYNDINNKQLSKKKFKLNQKTIRCLEDIELLPCTSFDSTVNFEKSLSSMFISMPTPSSTPIVGNPTETKLNVQTIVHSAIKEGSTPGSTYKVGTIVEPDFKYIKEWLLKYCIHGDNNITETLIYILKENYSKNYLNNIIIDNKYNRTFIGRIKKISKEIWPESNLIRDDRNRKVNSAVIKGLKLLNK